MQPKTRNNSFVLLLILFLERMAYYGIRSLIFYYFASGILNAPSEKSMVVYSYMGLFLIVAQIIGGIFGDFIMSHKKAILLGSTIAALGCVISCVPELRIYYGGLSLFLLGSGISNLNILTAFGKTHYAQKKLLDSMFTWYTLVLNVGAFIGIALFLVLSDTFGFPTAFLFGALLFVCVLGLSFAVSKTDVLENSQATAKNNFAVLFVLAAIFLSGIFWGLYEIGATHSSIIIFDPDFDFNFGIFTKENLKSLNTVFLLPICLVFALLWIKFYTSQFLKLAFGFLLGTFGLIAFSQMDFGNSANLSLVVIGAFFVTVAECLVLPMFMSIITRYANPKYLSMIFTAYVCFSYIAVRFISEFTAVLDLRSSLLAVVATIIFVVITIFLFLMIFLGKNLIKSSQNEKLIS